jgi:glucokinase
MLRNPVVLGRPPLIRQTNAQVLLRLLRDNGPCSKADLVRASGLSAPSVTNVVTALISTGLVETIGEGNSTGGRPPDILRFRAEHSAVAGVEITRDTLRFLLADLNGEELARSETSIDKSQSTPRRICQQISNEVRKLLRAKKLMGTQLATLTVGVPAIVNVDEGTVVALSALQNWSDVPLGPMLTREFKCRVVIDNDTNLAAEGEFYRGAAQGERDFVFVTIGEGVGAGIFLGGCIHRGSNWSAGEIGYLRVPAISRERPAIHAYGELEKTLSASGILKSWRVRGQSARIRSRVGHATDVWDLAAGGNAEAKRILKQHAAIVADVILDLALILNPSLILLGGEVGNHPVLLHELETLLEGSEFPVVRMALGTLGSSAVLWGAACTALEPAIHELLQARNPKSSRVSTASRG